MSHKTGALSTEICSQLYNQLEELIASEASLTNRLFRCRQVLEEVFKAITSQTNIAFTGLYARMQYAYESSILTQTQNAQLQLLRLLTNKVVHHDDVEFGEADFASAILILDETIRSLSTDSKAGNRAVSDFLIDKNARHLESLRSSTEQTIGHIFGVATSWKTSGQKGGKKFLEINCQTSEGTQLTVTLWEKEREVSSGRKWTLLEKSLWKYCNLSFYNLSVVAGVANRYQSTPLTLVVLEQDFLMDVSAVADCFQGKDYYPEVFLLNKFFSEPITTPLAKGKCVNHVFDELVSNPERPLREIFDEYLEENPNYVFALGDHAWQDIYAQVQIEHYNQLKEIASGLNKQNCQLEPSFISLKYGLHGRLDVMTLPDKKNSKYSILELKSGSAHPYDVWKAHQMQVVGYNLILKEIFGPANIASSSIFYSKSSETPLRHVVNNIMTEQDFLMCRNRIVGMLQKLATSPEQFVKWLKSNSRNYQNKFLTQKSDHIKTTLNSISDTELRWFISKLRLIFREVWAVKTGAFSESENNNYGFSSLWNCSLAEKKQQYRILDNLWVEKVSESTITFHRQDEQPLTNLRIGDIIVVYKQETQVNEQQLIRGKISYLDDEKIEVVTRCRIKEQKQFDKYTLWAIEPDLMESSLYFGLNSIYTCLSVEPDKRATILGNKIPEFSNLEFKRDISWRDDISESLKGMITAEDYYLVQGPPGTGKTSRLLMQYIGHILSETNKKVLLISFTNRAVDEICSHLDKENYPYIRFGANPAAGDISEEAKKKADGAKSRTVNPAQQYESGRIFISTCHTFASLAPDLLNKITMDELIIDEASQILEHHVIGLMARIRKTILIGDQNQLPPILLQQSKSGKESILEKLIVNADRKIYPNCYSMLTHHYRMHDAIARLVSDNYKNKLVSDSRRQSTKQSWMKTDNPELAEILATRVVWIDTQPSYQSKADLNHAKWIRTFVDNLSDMMPKGEICKKVGIISPFRAQAQCIISALGKKYGDITVDTVERYQGSERECIIMSYPLRYHHELQLLQSINKLGTVDRKLNVALSRAREQLIILGSSKVLTYSEFFHKVYSLVQENGKVVTIGELNPN